MSIQEIAKGGPTPKKDIENSTAGNAMVTLLELGIIFIDYLEKIKISNVEYYTNL